MFRFFGFRGTLERLFDQKKEKESRKSQIIHCLERLLKDWSIDEYDESTELAILTILVAMLYTLNNGQSSSMLPQDRNLNLARCVQQANQCAADIKAHSPHLAKSRPYLQWLLAKEHFNGQGNPNILFSERWEIQFLRFPGLALERNSLPSYIPLAIENPGWPVPDPKFSPSENLQWALEASKELLDYRTQAMLLKEIICRVEDPRLSFEELDKLSGLVQGDLVQLYESCLSQYLLTTDKISCQELLKRLRSIASQFQTAPDDDVCVATHWEGLMVQNALAKLVFENAELIGENARLAQKICKNLPFSQTIIDKFSQSISADEGPPSDGWMQRADILKLRQRNRDLERELHDMKLRREFNSFEDAERPKAGEEDNCKKLLGKTSNSCRGRLNDAPSGAPDSSPNQEPTLAENTEPKSRKMDEKGQSENKATEDLNPMTNEPDNIDCDTHIGEEKKPQALEKPHNFATVTNAHDEPTRFAKPSQYPANLCQYEKRTHLKSRAETAQPSGTFESDQLALEKNIGEESGSSRPASPAPSSG
ncbi:uncharacterized protein N7458_002789 [Penicillium daleae]|uniref:Uncharacterized protein n=1 Tax=Penicillium daleae TaxID=63821 RepID=A0AAD6CFU4_9EURO|nr:uncharacterized protein N7458_002789 [Penicillium daleae]KAJ5461237.1 hypothetical protein N7458_002789 [Penicillium daleae]